MQRRKACLAGLLMLIAWTATRSASAGQEVNAHALALAQFQKRCESYIALRDKVKASMPPPKPTDNPNRLVERQERLARAVAAARADAKAGDVFGAEMAPTLKEAIAADFRSRTPAQRAGVFKEVPKNLRLAVNDTYPKSVPLATVPPRLLANLPRLPDSLEYRFVGRRLILHDAMSNLVVDVLQDAVPAR